MSAEQLIEEFKALPLAERQKVVETILEDDSWVPKSFRDGMRDLEAGQTMPLAARD
jgi:hypothetical protein